MRVKGVFVLKKLGTILLAISIGALLSGCLVEKQKAVDVSGIFRTTDTLRIYRAGDFIDYNVTAVPSSSGIPQFGLLRIKWDSTASIQDPFGNIISPGLKETTTLTYDGSTDADAVVVQYVTQVTTAPGPGNSGIGSFILHAINDEIGAHYWPYAPVNVGTPSSPVLTPIIFDSPLTFGTALNSPQDFSVMQCDPNLCPNTGEIYKYTNSFEVIGDSRQISTELGTFNNPFEVNFSGGTQPQNNPALSFVGDIFDLCGDSTDRVNHNGNIFVMPQIGIIQINNTCTNSTTRETVQYNITARSTNIDF